MEHLTKIICIFAQKLLCTMANKDVTYQRFQRLFKHKDASVNYLINNYLNKTQAMFVYKNLPDTIPQAELEHLLQTEGKVFVTQEDGKLYAFSGTLGGDVDVYNRPTKYTVANVALKLNKVYDVNTDGVLMRNDYMMTGLLPIIGKYAVLLTDSVISLNTASILTRISMLISASDDKTKQSADVFLQKINDGDFSIIGENAFFKGISMQTAPTGNSVYISQLIELQQYYKANLLNELGLNANFNMKRERLNTQEVALNIDSLLPFVDTMFNERRKAVQAINEMYGTDIAVDLSSIWKVQHEANDILIEDTDTVTETDEQFSDEVPEQEQEQETEHTDTEIQETEETTDTVEDDKKKEVEK